MTKSIANLAVNTLAHEMQSLLTEYQIEDGGSDALQHPIPQLTVADHLSNYAIGCTYALRNIGFLHLQQRMREEGFALDVVEICQDINHSLYPPHAGKVDLNGILREGRINDWLCAFKVHLRSDYEAWLDYYEQWKRYQAFDWDGPCMRRKEWTAEQIRLMHHYLHEGKAIAHYLGCYLAKQQAIEYAGHGGGIATLPELLALRIFAGSGEKVDSYIADSEEYIGYDKCGKYFSPGTPTIVTVHGGGLTPERMKQYGLNGIRLSEEEFNGLLGGILPDGRVVDVVTPDDIRAGARGRLIVQEHKPSQPRRPMKEDDLTLARIGDLDLIEEYCARIGNDKWSEERCWQYCRPPCGYLLEFENDFHPGVSMYKDGYFTQYLAWQPNVKTWNH